MGDEASVQSITETGKIHTRRFADAKKAHATLKDLIHADLKRGYNATKIQALIDGNSPVKASRLERLGQSWRANVNWREAKSVIRQKKTAYWDLLMEVPSLVTVSLKGPAKRRHTDPMQQSVDYAQIIAEEYTSVLQDWDGFYFEMIQLSSELLKFGPAGCFWRNSSTWKFRAAKGLAMLTPKDTKANIAEVRFMFVRDTLQLDEISKILSDPESEVEDAVWTKQSGEEGWNIAQLRRAVMKCWKNGQYDSQEDPYQTGVYASAQQAIKNNEYGVQQDEFRALKVAHIFVREPSGKVSHLIIPEDYEPDGWLFSNFEKYGDMSEAMALFFYDTEDGYFHSSRGVGSEIYPHLTLSNRFLNSMVDGAIISASLLVKNTGNMDSEPRLLRLGPITELPAEVEPIQTSFAPQLSGLVDVRMMMHQMLNNNTGVFRPRNEEPNVPEKTARQVVSEENKEGRFEKAQTYSFYVDWDRLHRETYRRLWNPDYPEACDGYEEHREFVDNCLARGVPRELLNPKNLRMKAARSIGFGSASIRERVTGELVQLSPHFDEQGKVNAVRDRVAALAGYDKVDRYIPINSRDNIPSDASSHAQLENNDMIEGAGVVVGNDQPHLIHIRTHIPPIVKVMQQWEEQPEAVNLAQAAPYFNVAVPHLEQHTERMKMDGRYQKEVKSMTELIRRLTAAGRGIAQAFQKLQQQKLKAQEENQKIVEEAKGQVQSEETRMKLAEMQHRQQMELQNQGSIIQIREAKARHSMALADLVTQAKINRANVESQSKQTVGAS